MKMCDDITPPKAMKAFLIGHIYKRCVTGMSYENLYIYTGFNKGLLINLDTGMHRPAYDKSSNIDGVYEDVTEQYCLKKL